MHQSGKSSNPVQQSFIHTWLHHNLPLMFHLMPFALSEALYNQVLKLQRWHMLLRKNLIQMFRSVTIQLIWNYTGVWKGLLSKNHQNVEKQCKSEVKTQKWPENTRKGNFFGFQTRENQLKKRNSHTLACIRHVFLVTVGGQTNQKTLSIGKYATMAKSELLSRNFEQNAVS